MPLHHVELNVSNLKKSRVFWSWLLERLGYQLFQEWDKGFSYKDKENYLVFVQAETAFLKDGYHRKQIGLNHLAFWVDTEEEVNQLRAELLKRECPILYSDRFPFAGGENHYAVFFEYPDRVKVEVVAHTTTE